MFVGHENEVVLKGCTSGRSLMWNNDMNSMFPLNLNPIFMILNEPVNNFSGLGKIWNYVNQNDANRRRKGLTCEEIIPSGETI